MTQMLDNEEVQSQFVKACAVDDIETAGMLFSKYLDKAKTQFTNFVFEQGVLVAAKNGAANVARYLLDQSNFNNPFELSSMKYTVVFDCQDEYPNLEILECLCLHLQDKEELMKIKEDGYFKNKEFFDFYLNSRLEKENLVLALGAGEATPRKALKI